jgi:hypothetical protein
MGIQSKIRPLTAKEITSLWKSEEKLSEPFPNLNFEVSDERVTICLVGGETKTRKIESIKRPFERAIHREYEGITISWE